MNHRTEPRYEPFERLQVPVLVRAGAELRYINPELCRLLRIEPGSVQVPGPMADVIGRFVPGMPADAFRRMEQGPSAETGENRVWFTVRLGTGEERHFSFRGSPGPGDDERTVVVIDAAPEWEAKGLSEALASASTALLRCRTEEEVLDTTVELLSRQGFTAAVLLVSDTEFWHGPMRQVQAAVEAGSEIYGKPVEQVRYALEVLPGLTEMLRTRRAAFFQDAFERAAHLHPPEMLAVIRAHNPGEACQLEAPIFVDDRPYAVLGLQSRSLAPSAAGTFELFGQLVGRAIENVRHHLHVSEQLEKVRRLQAEVVQKERLSALGEAAAMVSHEVRNPLGAIINAVAVLKRGPTSNGARTELLQMIEEEALRLDGLVHDLLELARPLEPRFTAVDLGALASKVVTAAGVREEPHRLTLTASPGVRVIADPSLVESAVQNLVRNALQATPRTGTVHVEVDHRGDRIVLAVEDEGAGVAEADLARIFEPFYTTRATGTGLGLAVVKRVADVHGAEVRVGSGRRGGARFELLFRPEVAPQRIR